MIDFITLLVMIMFLIFAVDILTSRRWKKQDLIY
jgi:hypothetical protein